MPWYLITERFRSFETTLVWCPTNDENDALEQMSTHGRIVGKGQGEVYDTEIEIQKAAEVRRDHPELYKELNRV